MDLGSNEFVKEISGTFDRFDDIIYITSFKLVTNERTFGPWALPKGTPFSITAPAGSAIVGFYARGVPFLNAIGVYLKSLRETHLSVSALSITVRVQLCVCACVVFFIGSDKA